ncbi:MAG: protein TolQ [Candidatus Tectomicrobia bacterium]|nr:protein TolQ [Candidatus Tectomicrobia bacterium]MBI2131358.1 protein TolQ [Candidatus Tectomicrobia bacterium]MBI2177196.1 protein TolQ [Candidatus Tectomicrobia bacterium]MBI3024271.1 protein TolQ [Candidatus Tectomicrobia bacterium]
MWSLAFRSSGVVFIVLVLLISFSLSSWAVIIWKFFELRRAKHRSDDFLEVFWKAKRLDHLYSEAGEYGDSPVGQVFAAGYQEVEQVLKARSSKGGMEEAAVLTTTESTGVETVERALRRAANQEVGKLERLLTFLATTASATPFIGLFGTVWGIMNSFREIGARGSAGLAVVAPGISEALIATAVGLAAAIPAVIAYNHYQNRVKVIANDIENFTADFLNLVGRHFMRM